MGCYSYSVDREKDFAKSNIFEGRLIMALCRPVPTDYWLNPKVNEEYSLEDKLLYIYLITNEHLQQLGIYKISKKLIAVELNMDLEKIENAFDDLENIRESLEELNSALLVENSKHLSLNISEVKFFLNSLKKGNIDNINYKKRLIDTLVNKVYLYNDRATILFNVNNHIEEVEISLLEDVESSLFGAVALP